MKHLSPEPLCSPFTACMHVFLYSKFNQMYVCEWEIHSEVHLCLSIFCISMCVMFICMDLLWWNKWVNLQLIVSLLLAPHFLHKTTRRERTKNQQAKITHKAHLCKLKKNRSGNVMARWFSTESFIFRIYLAGRGLEDGKEMKKDRKRLLCRYPKRIIHGYVYSGDAD